MPAHADSAKVIFPKRQTICPRSLQQFPSTWSLCFPETPTINSCAPPWNAWTATLKVGRVVTPSSVSPALRAWLLRARWPGRRRPRRTTWSSGSWRWWGSSAARPARVWRKHKIPSESCSSRRWSSSSSPQPLQANWVFYFLFFSSSGGEMFTNVGWFFCLVSWILICVTPWQHYRATGLGDVMVWLRGHGFEILQLRVSGFIGLIQMCPKTLIPKTVIRF